MTILGVEVLLVPRVTGNKNSWGIIIEALTSV